MKHPAMPVPTIRLLREWLYAAPAVVWMLVFPMCPMVVGASGAEAPDVDADAVVRSLPRTVWFDPREGSYRAPRLPPLRDDPVRVEGWRAASKNRAGATAWKRPQWGPRMSDIFSAIVIALVAGFLVVTVGLLAYFSLRNYVPAGEHRGGTRSVVIDTARVDDLPFEATRTDYENPLAMAAQWARRGDYRRAIILVYGYLLLVLDQARKIELQKGKTNRMYLRELGTDSPLYPLTELAMLVFEDAFFGNRAITAEQFRSVWKALPEFHRLLDEIEPSPPQHGADLEVSGT